MWPETCPLKMTSDPIYPSDMKQPPGVELEDLRFVVGRDVERRHRIERDLDVVETATRIERHVGRKHHAIDAEEVEAAAQRGHGPDRDRVGMELVEILERMFLERNRFVPGTRRLEQ